MRNSSKKPSKIECKTQIPLLLRLTQTDFSSTPWMPSVENCVVCENHLVNLNNSFLATCCDSSSRPKQYNNSNCSYFDIKSSVDNVHCTKPLDEQCHGCESCFLLKLRFLQYKLHRVLSQLFAHSWVPCNDLQFYLDSSNDFSENQNLHALLRSLESTSDKKLVTKDPVKYPVKNEESFEAQSVDKGNLRQSRWKQLEILLENQKKEYTALYEYLCNSERVSDKKCKILNKENRELRLKLRELQETHKGRVTKNFLGSSFNLTTQVSEIQKKNNEPSHYLHNELATILKEHTDECEYLRRQLHDNRRILKLKQGEMEVNIKTSRTVQKKLQALLIQLKRVKDTKRKHDVELVNQKALVQELQKNLCVLNKEKQDILYSNKKLEETLCEMKSTLSLKQKENSYTKKLYEDSMVANKALHDQFKKQEEDILLQLESIQCQSLSKKNSSTSVAEAEKRKITGVIVGNSRSLYAQGSTSRDCVATIQETKESLPKQATFKTLLKSKVFHENEKTLKGQLEVKGHCPGETIQDEKEKQSKSMDATLTEEYESSLMLKNAHIEKQFERIKNLEETIREQIDAKKDCVMKKNEIITKYDELKKNFKKSMEEKEAMVHEQTMEKNALFTKYEKLKEDFSKVMEEKEALSKLMEEKEAVSKMMEEKETLIKLMEEKEALFKSFEEKEAMMHEQTMEKDALFTKYEKLKEDFSKVMEEKKALSKFMEKKEAISNSLEEKEDRVHKLTMEKDALFTKYEKLKEDFSKVLEEKEALSKLMEEKEAILQELIMEKRNLEGQVAEQRTALNKKPVKEDIEFLTKKYEELKKQKEDVENGKNKEINTLQSAIEKMSRDVKQKNLLNEMEPDATMFENLQRRYEELRSEYEKFQVISNEQVNELRKEVESCQKSSQRKENGLNASIQTDFTFSLKQEYDEAQKKLDTVQTQRDVETRSFRETTENLTKQLASIKAECSGKEPLTLNDKDAREKRGLYCDVESPIEPTSHENQEQQVDARSSEVNRQMNCEKNESVSSEGETTTKEISLNESSKMVPETEIIKNQVAQNELVNARESESNPGNQNNGCPGVPEVISTTSDTNLLIGQEAPAKEEILVVVNSKKHEGNVHTKEKDKFDSNGDKCDSASSLEEDEEEHKTVKQNLDADNSINNKKKTRKEQQVHFSDPLFEIRKETTKKDRGNLQGKIKGKDESERISKKKKVLKSVEMIKSDSKIFKKKLTKQSKNVRKRGKVQGNEGSKRQGDLKCEDNSQKAEKGKRVEDGKFDYVMENGLSTSNVSRNNGEQAETLVVKKFTNENVPDHQNAHLEDMTSFGLEESLNSKNTKPVENFATALLSKFEIPSFLEWPQIKQKENNSIAMDVMKKNSIDEMPVAEMKTPSSSSSSEKYTFFGKGLGFY